ncbi:MAG: ATP synthase F0 subunit B [Oscillospiraceae bacterium]|nr:ATP synthase F0 subunit B [Oscillospiraceae bacterium]
MFPPIAPLLSGSVPEGGLLDFNVQTLYTIGLTALSVGILYFILSKLLYKPVLNFMRAREDRINAQMDNAADEMAKAEELQRRYEQKIRELEAEKDEVLETARKLALKRRDEILAEAKTESDAAKARTRSQIEIEVERAEAAMKQSIIGVASAMAEKYVTVSLSGEVHDRLFAEAMAELGEMAFVRHSEPEEI